MNVGSSQLSAPPVGQLDLGLPYSTWEHQTPVSKNASSLLVQDPPRLGLCCGPFPAPPAHSLELHIRPSTVVSLIGSFVGLLPAFAVSWIQAAFPEWFLPNHVVPKQQKEGGEAQFDTEVKAYGRLKPLQGVVIPTFYGRLLYNGVRAMVLEHLGGVSLSSPEGATLRLEELSTLLQPCYRALHALGVHHDDPNLSNFQLVNGKIMVLDLESAVFDLSVDDQATFLKTNIWAWGIDIAICKRIIYATGHWKQHENQTRVY